MKQVTIDCSAITDRAAMHSALAEALSFPGWYGRNLDALYDCLTELGEATELILTDWDPTTAWADAFAEVFEEAAGDNPCLVITMQ